MFFSASLLLSLCALSALATPHVPRHNHAARHAALINARNPQPIPAANPLAAASVSVKAKRGDKKKCRHRPTTTSSSSASSAPTTSSSVVNAAPDPQTSSSSSSQAPPPPPPTSTHHDAPAPSPTHKDNGGGSNNGGGGGGSNTLGGYLSGVHTGDITFYELGEVACGQTYGDNDMVAAVSFELFDDAPGSDGNTNNSPMCNLPITVTYQGKSITVKIVDKCSGCDKYSVDLSPGAFSQLADQSIGRGHGATWTA